MPKPVADNDLMLTRLIDEIHREWPFYDSRWIRGELADPSHRANHKRV